MNFPVPKVAVAAALAGALVLAASAAQAHAHLVKASPAENAAVAAPTTIRLEFNEKLEPKFSAVELMKSDGAKVAVASKASGKTIEARPRTPLGRGGYLVMWRIVSTDGHKMKGQYNFTVK